MAVIIRTIMPVIAIEVAIVIVVLGIKAHDFVNGGGWDDSVVVIQATIRR